MFNSERREEIVNILEKSGSISVTKLSKLLYVSQPTIRRDLTALEKQGKVARTHGGGYSSQNSRKRNTADAEGRPE